MRIVYLITKSNFGGAQRYVYDLATAMRSRGHSVAVALGGRGPLFEKLEAAGVRTIPIPELGRDIDPIADLRSFFRIIDLLSDEKPEVFHLNSSKAGVLGALAARTWNSWQWFSRLWNKDGAPTRIIFTGHGWAFNEERSDMERTLIALLHWLTIMLAHRTIVVSRKTREQVMRLPLVWPRLTVIHNGVTADETLPQSDARAALFGEERSRSIAADGTIVIGTLAELHKNKGLSYAIEGMATLKKQRPDTHFAFAILGEGEERAELSSLITKLGLEDSVLLLGHRDGGAKFLSAFDIFLFTSITEAFPYAILEAGNAGLPIVSTGVGGIPEVVDDMQSGILIQARNSNEVARAVGFLLDHPERRESFGRTLAERIRGRFHVGNMVEETEGLYLTVVGVRGV